MTPARKEEIRAMLAKRDQIAIVGGPGWQDQESLDVIRELLAALEEAERAQQPTGPCEHERTTPRFGREGDAGQHSTSEPDRRTAVDWLDAARTPLYGRGVR